MLVVIEGLDGAGKSTQVRLMKEYLSKVCNRLEYIHFPRYDAPVYGDLIGKFLRGGFGPMDKVHPQLVALLFAEDRRDAAPSILKVLSEGGTVLLDRYVYSNIAYLIVFSFIVYDSLLFIHYTSEYAVETRMFSLR